MTERPPVCGMCGRLSKYNLDRNWCPFRAVSIRPDKPAGFCALFVMREKGKKQSKNGDEGVCEE